MTPRPASQIVPFPVPAAVVPDAPGNGLAWDEAALQKYVM